MSPLLSWILIGAIATAVGVWGVRAHLRGREIDGAMQRHPAGKNL
jgi:hypothetical protein